ncbi:MAG TPA: phosphoglucomutase/phosphomannomutase family protein [Bacteroidota bacterium]|nr:phosphoglucomutase/phosphomannomutase family protein [Bacteroidota bacterium]
MTQTIKFGTDGWRGVIADDYTFANLEKVALAAARFFASHKKRRNGIVIGYDARFMSREFAELSAAVMANAGIAVKLADSIVSTPMVSLLTLMENAAGGIVITASHNPARYNGFKIKGEFGGPAHPAMIANVEKELARVMKLKKLPARGRTLAELIAKGKITPIAMKQRYLDDLATKIDLDLIRRSGIRVLYDVMYGAGQKVLDEVLPGVRQIHEIFNPSFAGTNPEPLAQNLGELIAGVKAGPYDIGIATDGDADRIGAVDEKGNFVDSHRIFSLLLKYLVEQKKMTGEVVKSLSVTQMVDAQCAKYGLKLVETPVGFKHICQYMTGHDVLIGGEESGGLAVKGHLPERDGIFLGLMLCEVMAVRKKPLGALVQELMDEFGVHEFRRVDMHLSEKEKARVMKRFRGRVRAIGPYAVTGRNDTDGHKLFVDGGWVLVRASGTEPLIRVYAEGRSTAMVDGLLAGATGSGGSSTHD